MNILLVYPEIPLTFYSFDHALKFISKKSAEPPLGLLTIASMLPDYWNKKLIDTNVSKLNDDDLSWADYVFISAMSVQRKSFMEIIKRCNQLGVKVVAGGPLVSTEPEAFQGIDHFILYEAEEVLPQFVHDVLHNQPKRIYKADKFPPIELTPLPMWDLLKHKKYANLSIQYSRGCPYDCEFCSITVLNGRVPRTKSKERFIQELDAVYNIGWRGGISIVDDNFIGNKRKLKEEILPSMKEWGSKMGFPFHYTTEVSINLADDDELIDMMVQAGFRNTFIGIETPNMESLQECGKKQNIKRDLLTSINKIQKHGLIVSAGFIVGFDKDSNQIFNDQAVFIQKSGITTAMVGLLNAPSGTKLFKRMQDENRLLNIISGNNMDGGINFIPKMDYKILIKGYKELLTNIYSPKVYYERLKEFLNNYKPVPLSKPKITLNDAVAFLKSIWVLGIREKSKKYYWKILFHTLFKEPEKFAIAITLLIYGFHFRKIAENI